MCHRSSSGSLTRFRSSWAGECVSEAAAVEALAGLVQDPCAAFEIRLCLGFCIRSTSSGEGGSSSVPSSYGLPDRRNLRYGVFTRPQATVCQCSSRCILASNLCSITWLQCTCTPNHSFIGASYMVGAPMAKGLTCTPGPDRKVESYVRTR